MQETFRVVTEDPSIMKRQQEGAMKRHKANMRGLFNAIDVSKDDSISLDEFRSMLSIHDVKVWLNAMGLETRDVDLLFKLLLSKSTDRIHQDEFIDGVAHLKGWARSVDMEHLHRRLLGIEALIKGFRSSVP